MICRIVPIKDFLDYYISKNGDVFSFKPINQFTEKPRIPKKLKPNKLKNGYLQVGLYIKGIIYHKKVHRLVLETFKGPCPINMECRHLDGNKENNNVNNLKWDTHINNCKDRIKHGTQFITMGENNPSAKLNELQVRIIKRLLEFNTLTQKEISIIFNTVQSHISNININKRWKHI